MRSTERCELAVGARVRVVPNHACAAANLHAEMVVVEDGAIVDVWPVAVRGWSPRRGVGEPDRIVAGGSGH